MNFDTWFEKQSLVLKIILLVLPFVGWLVEILVRLSAYLRNKNTVDLIILIIFLVFGAGWILNVVDIVWLVLKGHLFFAGDLDGLAKEDEKPAEPKEEVEAEEKEEK